MLPRSLKLGGPLSFQLDVLIYPEQVRRVVAFLDLRQTWIILAVGRANAIFALFHHKVDVRATGRVRVQRAPIFLRPRGNFIFVRGVRIDSHNYLSPQSVAVPPSCCTLLDTAGCTIDGVEVHGGLRRRHCRSVFQMVRDRFVGKRTDEIGLPVPLHSGRIETIMQALQYWMRYRADQVERGSLEPSDWLEHHPRVLQGSGVAPNDFAHFRVVQMLGERRPRRDSEESKEPVDVIGGLGDKAAVP